MNLHPGHVIHLLALLATTACAGESGTEGEEGVRLMFREYVDGQWHSWQELSLQKGVAAGLYRHPSSLACRESVVHGAKAVRRHYLISNEDISRDRLLTFAVILPVKLDGEVTWWDDLYRRRVVTRDESCSNRRPLMWRFPFTLAVIYSLGEFPRSNPATFRLSRSPPRSLVSEGNDFAI